MTSLVDRLKLSSKRQLPVITQSTPEESAIACLAMLSNFYGKSINITSMRRNFSLSSTGENSIDELAEVSDKLDFSTRSLSITADSLIHLQLPCILVLEKEHYVVIKSFKNSKVVIHDPAEGVVEISIEEISSKLTGVAIELTPTPKFKTETEKPKAKLSSFLSNAIGLKGTLGKIILLSILLQIFVVATPYYVQTVMDDVLVSYDLDLLKILSIGFALLLLLQVMTSSIRSLVITIMGNQLSVQMSANLVRHLYNLPIDYFEKRHIGDVVSRVGSLEQIRKLLTTTIVESLVDGLMIIGLAAMMFYYSKKLTFIVIGFTFAYLAIRYFLFDYFKLLQRKIIQVSAIKDTNLMESIKNIQAIKLFNQTTDRLNLFNNLNVDNSNESIKLEKLKIIFFWCRDLLSGALNIVIVYLAAKLVVGGNFSVGMIFAFLAYKNQFGAIATNLIDKYIDFKMISLHLERLGDISLTEQEKNLGHRDKNLKIEGSLQLKNVNFSYSDDDNLVIRDINITVNKGDSVALIGPSGCGKSTLLKVMIGLLPPTSGEVIADEINIQQLGLQNYRSNVSSVMQNEKLMSGTILENICFFETHPNKALAEQCAIKAGIHWDILAMQGGYDSLLGDMGNTLSGGQIQRIILARALYRKPKILFLDEATSNLDFDLENHINKSIKSLDMTRIFIAHRQETIKSADRIIKFENGTFVEMNKEQISEIKNRSLNAS